MLMKINENGTAVEDYGDAPLVVAALGGDRQAYGKIVSRYQRLLCSLAFSALGRLSESEDVAQEAFVEGWKKLGSLKDPEKLKPWLCGILKYKISRHRRSEARQPVSRASAIEDADALESSDEATEAVAMRKEEQALLQQSLESMPEIYRETLILYYREHRSIERVASELDLSEDAVKQRMSRGRKMLQDKMMSFVEGALEQSAPGHLFTATVLAALVALPPPAKAAGIGVTATSVASTFKWASIAVFLASISGLISGFLGLRANLDQSRTKRERRAIIRGASTFMGVALLFVAGLFGLRQLASGSYGDPLNYAVTSQVLVIAFVIGYVLFTRQALQAMRELRTAERLRRPDLFASPDDQPGSAKGEYKSRLTLLGLPLVHVKFALPENGEKPAVAWIAAGDRAYGLLFAWGGIAVAPISVGIVSVGLLSVGAVGFGLIGMGTVGVGWLAFGATAIGYKAYASLSALGWESAFSQGFSIAKEAALGPIAYAGQINNAQAAAAANLSTVDQSYGAVLGIMALLVIVPVVWYARVVRRKIRKPSLD